MNTKRQKQISRLVPGKNKLMRCTRWFAILMAGITIGIFIASPKPAAPSGNTVSPGYSLAGMGVARQFACSCGSCGEKGLDDCTCPTASSTKQFIEMNLNTGASADEVLEMVKEAYGHFKG